MPTPPPNSSGRPQAPSSTTPRPDARRNASNPSSFLPSLTTHAPNQPPTQALRPPAGSLPVFPLRPSNAYAGSFGFPGWPGMRPHVLMSGAAGAGQAATSRQTPVGPSTHGSSTRVPLPYGSSNSGFTSSGFSLPGPSLRGPSHQGPRLQDPLILGSSARGSSNGNLWLHNDRWIYDASTGGRAPIDAAPIHGSSIHGPSNGAPSIRGPSIRGPSNSGPSNSGPSSGGPSNGGPSSSGPSSSGPSTQGPSTQGPSTQGPSTQGPSTQGPSTQGPPAQDRPTQAPAILHRSPRDPSTSRSATGGSLSPNTAHPPRASTADLFRDIVSHWRGTFPTGYDSNQNPMPTGNVVHDERAVSPSDNSPINGDRNPLRPRDRDTRSMSPLQLPPTQTHSESPPPSEQRRPRQRSPVESRADARARFQLPVFQGSDRGPHPQVVIDPQESGHVGLGGLGPLENQTPSAPQTAGNGTGHLHAPVVGNGSAANPNSAANGAMDIDGDENGDGESSDEEEEEQPLNSMGFTWQDLFEVACQDRDGVSSLNARR